MAQHLTEEEQIAKLKSWWADNGRSVVIGVVVAVVGYFGWQGWQAQQQQKSESASLLYQDLSNLIAEANGANLNEEQRLQAASITDELKDDYGSVLYASNGAMLMAKLAVEQGDLDRAEQDLRWVVEQNRSEELALLARLRLAQVLYGKGENDAALALLSDAEPGAYTSAYAELRGDLLVAKNQMAEARQAYEQALAELLAEQSNRRDIIQMKLDDVRVSDSATATPAAPAQATEAES